MWARRLIDQMIAAERDDDRYARSAAQAAEQHGTTTRVQATEADAVRLGLSPDAAA